MPASYRQIWGKFSHDLVVYSVYSTASTITIAGRITTNESLTISDTKFLNISNILLTNIAILRNEKAPSYIQSWIRNSLYIIKNYNKRILRTAKLSGLNIPEALCEVLEERVKTILRHFPNLLLQLLLYINT